MQTTDHNVPSDSDRVPTIQSAAIDRLNLEQALRDFETANARVVDLTGRLTLLHEDLLRTRHELTLARLRTEELAGFQARAAELGAEVHMLRTSRSFRIGYKITRVLRKLVP